MDDDKLPIVYGPPLADQEYITSEETTDDFGTGGVP